jgi:gliding motility-associated lipoprotein GldH
MKHNIWLIIIPLLTALIYTSCDNKTVYDEYRHTPISGWEKNDSLLFDIQPLAESGIYEESVGLRINSAYPFRDLCIIIEHKLLTSKKTITDTLKCQFVEKDGTVKGNGIGSYQYKFKADDMNFQKGERLHICIRHNMKREILQGISDIGLSIHQVK